MEENTDIRDILLKMLELQQKQYDLAVENSNRTRLVQRRLARQIMVFFFAGLLLVGANLVFILL